jgi:hypothetical protein
MRSGAASSGSSTNSSPVTERSTDKPGSAARPATDVPDCYPMTGAVVMILLAYPVNAYVITQVIDWPESAVTSL